MSLLDVVLFAGSGVPEGDEGALEGDNGVFFDDFEVTAVITETDLAKVKVRNETVASYMLEMFITKEFKL